MGIADDPEYRALLHYAARIGADPALVQAAGGNVSLKRDGVLWVKASGTWLAHAQDREIMVPVLLAPLLAAVDAPGEAAERAETFVVAEDNPAGLRPSIETTLHAALPHPVVVHVHCVETIAWAAHAQSETLLAPKLAGLRWAFIPYVRPGVPLTRAILERAAPGTDVLVLGNHGLVVGGATTEAAAALLADVVHRLRRPTRAFPPADARRLAALAEGSDYTPAEDAAVHAIGVDHQSLAVARLGSLYPDHVIYLGSGIVALNEGETAATQASAAMLVAPGTGVLLRRDASAGAVALARCLADVTARLSPDDALTWLTPLQDGELLGWDAEKYRQSLDVA